MWYELIPAAAITILGIVAISPLFSLTSYLGTDHMYGRKTATIWSRIMFTRDVRITGDSNKSAGLESIPDI